MYGRPHRSRGEASSQGWASQQAPSDAPIYVYYRYIHISISIYIYIYIYIYIRMPLASAPPRPARRSLTVPPEESHALGGRDAESPRPCRRAF